MSVALRNTATGTSSCNAAPLPHHSSTTTRRQTTGVRAAPAPEVPSPDQTSTLIATVTLDEATISNETTTLDETTLLARASDGDSGAFGELVRRHHDAAYRLALRIMGSAPDAEPGSLDRTIHLRRTPVTRAGESHHAPPAGPPWQDPWEGKKLGKYTVRERIGGGGMGIVYRAHDDSLDRDVAVKLLPVELSTDSSYLERFLAEAKSVMNEIDDAEALDAGMIASAQAVEHYEITRYGTMIAWAGQLGRADAAKLLKANLDQEYAADQKLSDLAQKALNREAA